MYAKIRPHLPQLFRYLISGGSAAALEIGSNQLMLWMWGPDWYFLAASISGAIGLTAAFLGHKFFAFKKKSETKKQLVRYIILQACNYVAQLGMITLMVEVIGIPPSWAKVFAIGITVMWNFFIYKLFVYV
jgi:putative flippase GtrA